jgi:hypothetical protein
MLANGKGAAAQTADAPDDLCSEHRIKSKRKARRRPEQAILAGQLDLIAAMKLATAESSVEQLSAEPTVASDCSHPKCDQVEEATTHASETVDDRATAGAADANDPLLADRMDELIAVPYARRVAGDCINAMRVAKGENARLIAIRDFSRALDPFEHDAAFGHVTEMARDAHDLDVDITQGALDEGQRLRRRDFAADHAPLPNVPSDPPNNAKGFSFVTYAEAKAGSSAPRWLLKFLLAYDERSAWVGAPGSLKSAILIALAHAVASGNSFLGRRNKGACAVIYFALERADLVKRRLRAYAEREGRGDLPVAVVGKTINFMDEKVVTEIVATIDAVEKTFGIKVGLLIVDTLAKAIGAGGGDEDKAKDQGKVYANLQRVTEQRSVHTAIVCHPGKNEKQGIRGSSAAPGDFGIIVEISGKDIRTATITKNNDGAEGPLASFQSIVHDFGKDEDGDPIEVCLAEPLEHEPAPPTSPKPSKPHKWWSKDFCKAMNAIMDGAASIRPFADGPLVRAVPVETVRDEFYKSYHNNDSNAKRTEFNKQKAAGVENGFVTTREIDGVQMIWFCKTEPSEPGRTSSPGSIVGELR